MGIAPDFDVIKLGLSCKCPRCRTGDLFAPGFMNMSLRNHCANCGLNLSKNDSADGPAVFLIFILGALLVPLALWVDAIFSPPLWLHALIWSVVALSMTIGALRPLKAYIIALQFKHRPGDWE